MESRFQLLFIAEEHSQGDVVRGDWAGVEFDCLGCGRMVCAHLLRDVYYGRAELPVAGARELYPDGYLRRRCARTVKRNRDGDPHCGCDRPACLAAADCVERQIQI